MLAGVSRRRRPEFLEGLSNYFFFFFFFFSCVFLLSGNFSMVAFLLGVFFFFFFFFFFDGDFSFWSGEGHFLYKVIYFYFSPSPLLGKNKAFMAEPSDRPAINDRLGGRKKAGCKYEKKKQRWKEKKT